MSIRLSGVARMKMKARNWSRFTGVQLIAFYDAIFDGNPEPWKALGVDDPSSQTVLIARRLLKADRLIRFDELSHTWVAT